MKSLYEKLTGEFGVSDDDVFMYGHDMAKVNYQARTAFAKRGKLILITATNPTDAGEGKTTTAIGLLDAMNALGLQTLGALREPSMGPVFGMKGCATGGGECELVPADKINLHFTGDFHAITSANNLISAVIDSSIYWGNQLRLDLNRIAWRRCLDVNDRALRDVTIEIKKSVTREEHFMITAASEMMAIMALAKNWDDLTYRLNRILIGYNLDGAPVYLEQLNITGSLLAILQDAINPNVVLTKQGNLSFVHCGPFANIAHGTNSVLATSLALRMGDYVVTEAGFGSDLGLEKYFDLISATNDFSPSAVVLVVSIRTLKLHAGCVKEKLEICDLDLLSKGFVHLEEHYAIINRYNVPCIISINRFAQDDEREIAQLCAYLDARGYRYAINSSYKDGPSGAVSLARLAVDGVKENRPPKSLFAPDALLSEKIKCIIEKIYKVKHWIISQHAQEQLAVLEQSTDTARLPVCMVKSHLTVAGNKLNENMDDYVMTIHNVDLNRGAGFVRVYSNDVITMPGLNKMPACFQIQIINGKIKNMK